MKPVDTVQGVLLKLSPGNGWRPIGGMLRHSKVAGEATMPIERTLACYVSLLLGLVVSTDAPAQVNFRIGFAGQVDCDQPVAAKNIPVRMEGTGVLNLDGSATAEVTQTAFVLSSTIQFRGRLGAPPAPAPGGTSQVRVAGRDSLRLIWNLPNNQFVVNIQVKGQSCSAQ